MLYFNSRPSARGDWHCIRRQRFHGISIHAPPRGATILLGRYGYACVISIHAPPRGATWRKEISRKSAYFNSRPSARGDRCIVHREGSGIVFQFTPLREGRRHTHLHSCIGYISIHAPPRGATRIVQQHRRRCTISIHAPPRGATPTESVVYLPNVFQFTPLREGRLIAFLLSSRNARISIHAPPRGATKNHLKRQYALLFQFTPLREGRLEAPPFKVSVSVFQFTPLREGRLSRRRLIVADTAISIHAPPRGATKLSTSARKLYDISIHAPPRGATGNMRNVLDIYTISIHAPPRGATELHASRRCRLGISIHAPPRGATPNAGFIDAEQDAISIHAPPRGATPFPASHCPRCTHFNSRPSARGDVMENGNCAVERFQFTPLREGRRNSWARGRRTGHFNSRPSARGDRIERTA